MVLQLGKSFTKRCSVLPGSLHKEEVPRELWPISQLPSPQELVGSVMQPHQNTPLTNAHTVDSWRTR
jgi:hypothetical protein